VLYHRKRIAELRRAGRCLLCQRAQGPVCENCRGGLRERYAELRRLGLCTKCGRPSGGSWGC